MANFLDDAINATGNSDSFLGNGINKQDFSQNGFIVPPISNADGNGLPSNKVLSNKIGVSKRNPVHWFVPEFGIVKMYVNPKQILYTYKKLIQKERTKGGFSLQYWGEDLPTLGITGTTGSSGIEGINVLYEIYRAEQLAFDGIGLSLSASNDAQNVASQLISGGGSSLGSAIGGNIGGIVGGGIAEGIFGAGASAQLLSPRNIPTLAQYAFGVEMYYLGWVHRGYFMGMTVTETAESVGLIDYSMDFIVTERRGYRYNSMPWSKSAIDGQSGNAIPYSFSKMG